ncbi:gamma-glutamyltranspeptidase [Aspergillus alliaceus]|uniref:Glutathione hydrolase n=1 Tax=Petromyces alliaceus TaxID=209559 RepID=A0A5N7C5A5_PETAA|nr:gamma-glutamyltranspeptidase [Aspergillus alliaceus]
MSFIATILCAASLAFTVPALPSRAQGEEILRVPVRVPKRGAVASQSKKCSDIGVEMLKIDGTAADAMIATVLCDGVVSMYHSGIGGGGFMLVHAPNGTSEFIDFRETAPRAVDEEAYLNDPNASKIGGSASGVPGEIRGLEHLHKNYGRLPWKYIVDRVALVAEEGFTVTEDMVHYMEMSINSTGYNFLVRDPSWAIDFAPNGILVKQGDTMTRKRYAATLREIADYGPDAFYKGKIARSIVRNVRSTNGNMTESDLLEYGIIRRDTSEITYRGYNLTSTTAPTSGAVGLSILKILERYTDFFQSGNEPLSTHRMNEAIRYGYARRSLLGDPDFSTHDLKEYQQWMLADSTASLTKIDDCRTHHNSSYYIPGGLGHGASHGTSHMSAVDKDGLAIALTTTVNLWFGSRVMTDDTGIVLNDEMDDFYIPHGSDDPTLFPQNRIQPGKRPLSTISPTIVTRNGELYFVTGAAGGTQIATTTLQGIINVLDRDMNTFDALAEPRLHDQLFPDTTNVENPYQSRKAVEGGYNTTIVDYLRRKGHDITWFDSIGMSQSIRLLPDGSIEAVGEPRQVNSGGAVWPEQERSLYGGYSIG